MPSVSVMINGKAYRMACDEGQEQHLLDLGAQLNETIDDLRGAFGEIGDQRLIVMAAITMADGAAEARGRASRAEAELKASNRKAEELGKHAELAIAVNSAADRIADIANRLNASK